MLDFDFYSPTRLIFGRDRENEAGSLASTVWRENESSSITAAVRWSAAACSTASWIHSKKRAWKSSPWAVSLPIHVTSWSTKGSSSANARGSIWSSLSAAAASSIPPRRSPSALVTTAISGISTSTRENRNAACGLGTIITLPATGSEGSNSSVINRANEPLKRGLRSDLNRPDFSIINPELTLTLPIEQIACGSSDMLSHIMERYFTTTEDVGLTDHLCEGALRSIIEQAPLALKNPTDYEPRANLFLASTIAHVGLLGVGRTEDWSAHALEAELSGCYNTAHGAGLAALYPAWILYMLPHRTMRIAQFAERVLGVPLDFKSPEKTGRDGVNALSNLFQSWGLPKNLKAMGIPREDLPTLAKRAKRNPDGTCGNFLPLKDEDVLAIYELAWDFEPQL